MWWQHLNRNAVNVRTLQLINSSRPGKKQCIKIVSTPKKFFEISDKIWYEVKICRRLQCFSPDLCLSLVFNADVASLYVIFRRSVYLIGVSMGTKPPASPPNEVIENYTLSASKVVWRLCKHTRNVDWIFISLNRQ